MVLTQEKLPPANDNSRFPLLFTHKEKKKRFKVSFCALNCMLRLFICQRGGVRVNCLACKKVIVLVFFLLLFLASSWAQFGGSVEAGSEDRSWILCGATVGRDVNGREESFARANLAGPPVLLGAVRHRDDVASSEVQLAALLRSEIV